MDAEDAGDRARQSPAAAPATRSTARAGPRYPQRGMRRAGQRSSPARLPPARGVAGPEPKLLEEHGGMQRALRERLVARERVRHLAHKRWCRRHGRLRRSRGRSAHRAHRRARDGCAMRLDAQAGMDIAGGTAPRIHDSSRCTWALTRPGRIARLGSGPFGELDGCGRLAVAGAADARRSGRARRPPNRPGSAGGDRQTHAARWTINGP